MVRVQKGKEPTTATIELTAATLRTLGEGVLRLNDGDLNDIAQADEVIATLKALGYVHAGYEFIVAPPRFVLTLNGQDYGTRENEADVATLVRNAWMHGRGNDGADQFQLWDHEESRWREDLVESVLRFYR